jgi:hypothetical protein
VGEAGAKGWAAWVSSGRPDHIPSAPNQPKSAAADPAGLILQTRTSNGGIKKQALIIRHGCLHDLQTMGRTVRR